MRPQYSVALVFLSLMLTSCSHIPPSTYWQDTVDAMATLTRGQVTPEHLKKLEAKRTGDEFNINEYFSLLKHLSPEPGYVLDYVYNYGGMGGEPVVYARKKKARPHETFQAYLDSQTGDVGRLPHYDYLEHVKIDDTAEGFFEYVVLHIMAGQFYLYWHANYNDFMIISDDSTLKALLANIDKKLTSEMRRKAKRIDPKPQIQFEKDKVRVKVLLFSKWKGLLEDTYEINRTFPHAIDWLKRETLVPYDISVRF